MRLGVLAAVLAGAFVLAPVAAAHTAVRETSIADNATLAAPPTSFTVVFTGRTGLAGVTLTNAAGRPVALDYAPPHEMADSFTIPLPRLAPGAYALSWRTISRDGHAMTGAVRFTIAG